MIFGTDPAALGRCHPACRKATQLPLIVKLSPNVTDIRVMARAAAEGGADIISLINTFVGMAIDVERRRPVLANVCGGLSGPAIRPAGVWLTWQVYQAVQIPLIGIGGIMNARDAVEFILAGASAVQIGTANFVTPSVSTDIVTELETWLAEHNIGSVRELIGGLELAASRLIMMAGKDRILVALDTPDLGRARRSGAIPHRPCRRFQDRPGDVHLPRPRVRPGGPGRRRQGVSGPETPRHPEHGGGSRRGGRPATASPSSPSMPWAAPR